MVIVIDYDGTYNRDSKMWDLFIDIAKNSGHQVICCTMRYPHEGLEVKNTIGKKCEIVFTGRLAKKNYMEKYGYKVDIWIDDRPDFILTSAVC